MATSTDSSPSGAREAIAAWRDDLEAACSRDALVNFHDGSSLTLDLAAAHPSGLAGFLAGRTTKLSHLFRQPSVLNDALRRTRSIRLTCAGIHERHGLHSAYVVSGVARWMHDDPATGEPTLIKAPILLHPVTLRSISGERLDEQFDMSASPHVNPALLRVLRQAGVDVEPEEMERLVHGAHGFNPRPAYNYLRHRARDLADFSIADRTVLGVFLDVYSALADQVSDLAGGIEADDELARIAAYTCGQAVGLATKAPSPTSGEREREPAHPILALDADQTEAYTAFAGGRSVCINAPAGTGATQLVTAALAEQAGRGRRTLLVVARPRDARDVRLGLGRAGLEHLIDDPQGITSQTIDLAGATEAEPCDLSPAETAMRMVDWRCAMAGTPAPWGVSVTDTMDAITALQGQPRPPQTTVRLPRHTLQRFDKATCAHARKLLTEFARQGGFTVKVRNSPWAPADLREDTQARDALGAARRLADENIDQYVVDVARLARSVGLRAPDTLQGCRSVVKLLTDVAASTTVLLREVYQRPLPDMVAATASSQWRGERGITMSLRERLRWRKQARALVAPGAKVTDLHAELDAALAQRNMWQQLATSGGWPTPAAGTADTAIRQQAVLEDLATLNETLGDAAGPVGLLDAPIADVVARVKRLAADETGAELPDRVRLLGNLVDLGLQPLVDDLRERSVQVESVPAEFEFCWWSSLFDELSRDIASQDSYHHLQRDLVRAQRGAREAAARGVASRTGGTALVRVVTPLRLPEVTGESFDSVVIAGAHAVAVPEGVIGLRAAPVRMVIGDLAGIPAVGLEESMDGAAARESILCAAAAAMQSVGLRSQHRMPAQLAQFSPASSAWSVPMPGDPTRLVHVPARARADAKVNREVRATVTAVLDHVRHTPAESLAVVAFTRKHARDIADAVRAELASELGLARWFTESRAEPFVVTDMHRCEDVVRDHVIVSCGIMPTPDYPLSRLLGSLDRPGAVQALAAAFTRARSGLTLVTSMTREDIIDGDCETPLGEALLSVLERMSKPWSGSSDQPMPMTPGFSAFAARLGRAGLDVMHTGSVDGWPDIAVGPREGGRPVAVSFARPLPAADATISAAERRKLVDIINDEMARAVHLQRFGWVPITVTRWDVFTTPDLAHAWVAGAAGGGRTIELPDDAGEVRDRQRSSDETRGDLSRG